MNLSSIKSSYKILAFISILLFFILNIQFLKAASIKGNVKDIQTAEPLSGVTIKIEKTAIGTITNRNGEFLIKRISKGKFNLLASMIGYEAKRIQIEIVDSDTLHLVIEMTEQPLQTSEIIVSASKRVQAVQEVPISVAVIDSRGLQQRAITKLDEAMKYIPGVEVNKDNVSIRGSSGFSFGVGSRVLVLLDGYPFLSGDQNDIKYDALPLFNVERIEVVKGAGSALYGTSALGGVINVITAEPKEEASFKIKAFSGVYTEPYYEQWKYSNSLHLNSGVDLGYSQKIGLLGVSLSGGIYKDQSFRLFDESFRWNIFSKFKYDISQKTYASLSANYADDSHSDWVYWKSLEYATLPPENVNQDDEFYSKKLNIVAEVNHIFNDNYFLNIKSGLYRTNYYNNYSENDAKQRSSIANSLNSEIQFNSRFNSQLFITTGFNFTANIVDATLFGGDNTQYITSLYTQGEYKFMDYLTATLGGRFDYENTTNLESNSEISPKLGVAYTPIEHLNLRMSIGKGFRSPTVAERFANLPYSGFTVINNPELNPETSWSYEIGGSYQMTIDDNLFQFDLSIFQNEMYDLIEPSFVQTATLNIQFQNVTRARIIGVDLGIKAFLFDFFGLETSLTAMEPKDLTLDETLKYRSKFLWYSRIMIPLNYVEFQMDYRYKSRSETIDSRLGLPGGIQDADKRVELHLVDARLIVFLDKFTEIPIRTTIFAKNLLDYYYTEIVGNLGPTRYIGLQIEADIK